MEWTTSEAFAWSLRLATVPALALLALAFWAHVLALGSRDASLAIEGSVMVVVVGSSILAWVGAASARIAYLELRGSTDSARVVRTFLEPRGKTAAGMATLAFRGLERDEEIAMSRWSGLKPGDSMIVAFLRDEPADFAPTASADRSPALAVASLGIVPMNLLVLGLAATRLIQLLLWRRGRRRKRSSAGLRPQPSPAAVAAPSRGSASPGAPEPPHPPTGPPLEPPPEPPNPPPPPVPPAWLRVATNALVEHQRAHADAPDWVVRAAHDRAPSLEARAMDDTVWVKFTALDDDRVGVIVLRAEFGGQPRFESFEVRASSEYASFGRRIDF